MKCAECSNIVNHMYDEDIQCECGHTIVIQYYICNGCGFIYRFKDGEFMDGVAVSAPIVDMAMDYLLDAVSEDIGAVSEDIGEEDANRFTMSNFLHSCIKCESVATEIKPGYYVCTSCDFEWEVEDCDV